MKNVLDKVVEELFSEDRAVEMLVTISGICVDITLKMTIQIFNKLKYQSFIFVRDLGISRRYI